MKIDKNIIIENIKTIFYALIIDVIIDANRYCPEPQVQAKSNNQ